MASQSQIFRVESIPSGTSIENVLSLFNKADRPGIRIKSLASHSHDDTLVATISFTSPEGTLRYPSTDNSILTIDDDFEGLTTLHDGESVDIIAVSDLFEHPYYSWSPSAERAWLRDALPTDIVDARVMLYGHDVELYSEKGLLEACAEKFLRRLEQASTRCQTGKPMMLLGFRTGCLVVEKAMVMVRARANAGFKVNLAGVIFFDAPRTGLPDYFLDMLPEGRSKIIIAGELREGSSTLRELDADFAHAIGTTSIISLLPMEALDMARTSDWMPNQVIIHEGRRDTIAQLRPTPAGQYHSVVHEIKQCLESLPALQQPKPARFTNFSMPARVPKSSVLHNLQRNDSLSPLTSPKLREDSINDSQIMGYETQPLRETSNRSSSCTSPPSPLQRISDAASKSRSPSFVSFVSRHSSGASSISSIQSILLNRNSATYSASPAQTPSSQRSSFPGFPFPSRPQLETPLTPPDSQHTTPRMSSSSSIDRIYHIPPSPISASKPHARSLRSGRPASTSRPKLTRRASSTMKPPSSFLSIIKRAAAPPKSESVTTTIMEELNGFPISLSHR